MNKIWRKLSYYSNNSGVKDITAMRLNLMSLIPQCLFYMCTKFDKKLPMPYISLKKFSWHLGHPVYLNLNFYNNFEIIHSSVCWTTLGVMFVEHQTIWARYWVDTVQSTTMLQILHSQSLIDEWGLQFGNYLCHLDTIHENQFQIDFSVTRSFKVQVYVYVFEKWK